MDTAATPPPTATSAEAVGSAAAPVFPVPPRTRRERLRDPLVVGAVVGGLTIALHFRDPHSSGSWGLCPWFEMTGLYCPGCGGLRAVNDLTNGDVLGAASSNLVFVVAIPFLLLWWGRWLRRAWTGAEPAPRNDHATAWIAALSVVMVVFAVLRNLPFAAWLAP